MTDCKNCKYTDEYCASGDCNKIQANNLACNKISLTEQWKKGELLEGFYYVKCDWSDEVEIRYVHNGVDDWQAIIEQVPSYDGYMTLIRAYNDVVDENTKLKELLKECREEIGDEIDDCTDPKIELFAKIQEVLK